MSWLVRDGEVLATVEVAATRRARRRGLLGRSGLEGALVLQPCRQVHTIGMRFPIDVAFVDGLGFIRRIATLPPYRLSRICMGAVMAIEAEAGAFARWDLRVGDQIEIKE
jgi:hypothetical protein